uniref:Cmp-sialic acid transporter 1-like isoform x1 n=1 Tax=Tetraselmis sp. GSL018 TaxID=582737 RepID=A0A061RH02_9CHLO
MTSSRYRCSHSDALKLCVSAIFLSRDSPERRKITTEWWIVRLYIVPAICYFLHNNLMFMVLGDVNPWTYMIIANLKIATTAVMFRVLLGRRLTKLQWHALVLLVAGTLISQVDDCSKHGLLAISYQSLFEGLLLGLFSAMAGTYTEMFLRANDDSLYWQNAQMYFFSFCCNIVNVLLQGVVSRKKGFPLSPTVLFAGFNAYALLSVLVLAFAGLLVSWIMKHTNTIVKVYSNIAGMFFTMMASHFFLGMSITLPTILGFTTVCTGSALYYLGLKELWGSEVAAEYMPLAGGSQAAPCHTRACTHPSLIDSESARSELTKGT